MFLKQLTGDLSKMSQRHCGDLCETKLVAAMSPRCRRNVAKLFLKQLIGDLAEMSQRRPRDLCETKLAAGKSRQKNEHVPKLCDFPATY